MDKLDVIEFLPPAPKDAELFLEYRQDPETCRFNPLKNLSLNELRSFLSAEGTSWLDFESKDSLFWFVSNGQQIVGTARIQNINRMMLTAEIGYGTFAQSRNQGVASKIVQKLTHDAFLQSPLRKLFAYVHEENIASRRVLEKTGYIQEGLLREHYLINNVPANEVVYGILKHEVI